MCYKPLIIATWITTTWITTIACMHHFCTFEQSYKHVAVRLHLEMPLCISSYVLQTINEKNIIASSCMGNKIFAV